VSGDINIVNLEKKRMNKSRTLNLTRYALLFWTFVLGACTQTGPAPDALPISSAVITLTPYVDSVPSTELPVTQNIPPTDEPCGYMWASQNLTDLTLDLQAAIKNILPEAQAYAFAFGEDCVYQDGHRKFIAMETDFNVSLPVADLTDDNNLGEWIIKTMQVIESLSKDKIVGPRPGRVTIIFTTGAEQKFIVFYIDKYQALPKDMAGWEVYQSLQKQ
jgi:hypothetical protein